MQGFWTLVAQVLELCRLQCRAGPAKPKIRTQQTKPKIKTQQTEPKIKTQQQKNHRHSEQRPSYISLGVGLVRMSAFETAIPRCLPALRQEPGLEPQVLGPGQEPQVQGAGQEPQVLGSEQEPQVKSACKHLEQISIEEQCIHTRTLSHSPGVLLA